MHRRMRSKVVGAIKAAGAAWRKRNYQDFLIVFNWHQVTPTFDPYRHHKYTWTSLERFEGEIEYLIREFQILPLYEAIAHLKSGSLRGACAALSFDDGDISVAEHVVPLLRRLNLAATFFINTAYLDDCCSYWFPILSYLRAVEDAEGRSVLSDDLRGKALQLRLTNDPRFYNEVRTKIEELGSLVPNLDSRLVSAEWLSSLDGDQFAIGAHGHEHQRFSLMPSEWQRNDLRKNVEALTSLRGYRPIFAVPFGRAHDWTEETIRIAREQGLDIVLADGGINFTSGALYRRIPSDDRSLRRLLVDEWTTVRPS